MPEPDVLAMQGKCLTVEQNPLISVQFGSPPLLTLNIDLDLVC